jgi:putative colanic acid biosynthesis acetyltransferase WcaF
MGKPFVSSSAKIEMPWQLTLEDRACVGPEVRVYNLAEIHLGARSTLAQESYLCTGTHAFDQSNMALVTAAIMIGQDAFVGARAFVCAGVDIGDGAIIGACSVVTRDVEPWTVVAGNPCRALRRRGRPQVHTP